MPHHNRARLAEINEKDLNPNKKYVAGKNGILVDPSESNAVLPVKAVLPRETNVKDFNEVKETEKKEKETFEAVIANDEVVTSEIDSAVSEKQESLKEKDKQQEKKKSKSKFKVVPESKF